MGTGIVSVGLLLTGHDGASDALLVATAALWVALAGLLAVRVVGDARAVRHGARSAGALTAVAATSVLGTRAALGGHHAVAAVLFVVATALLVGLLGPVLRALPRPAPGGAFLVCVAPASIAVLAATLAAERRAAWLLAPAVAVLVLALALYVVALRRFALVELLRGAGDHWIAGGALAICALAGGELQAAAVALDVATPIHGATRAVALALWIAAMAWLPVLVVAEVARPRPRFHVLRWATVFPVGMYAAMSVTVGRALPSPALLSFARVWIWAAVATWAIVAIGALRAAPAALRG